MSSQPENPQTENRESHLESHLVKNQREKGQVWILSRTPQEEWRVLLLKTKPERGAFWQPVTGSIEENEAIHMGALREAIEETGLPPLRCIEPLGFDFSFEGRWGPAHETAFYYETYGGCPKVTLDAREHQTYRWATFEEVRELLHYEPNRQAFQKLVAKLTSR